MQHVFIPRLNFAIACMAKTRRSLLLAFQIGTIYGLTRLHARQNYTRDLDHRLRYCNPRLAGLAISTAFAKPQVEEGADMEKRVSSARRYSSSLQRLHIHESAIAICSANRDTSYMIYLASAPSCIRPYLPLTGQNLIPYEPRRRSSPSSHHQPGSSWRRSKFPGSACYVLLATCK